MIYDCFSFFNELDLLEIRLSVRAGGDDDDGTMKEYLKDGESGILRKFRGRI